jgi:hypothetical protein
MDTLERELIDKIRQLDEDEQRRVLTFVNTLKTPEPKQYSARELMKLPPDERNRLMAMAFQAAENEVFETFEAYSEETIDADDYSG